MNVPQTIVDAVVHELGKLPAELVPATVSLIKRVASAPDPKAALARALQVTAHEQAADAAIDAAFAAKAEVKNGVPGSGV